MRNCVSRAAYELRVMWRYFFLIVKLIKFTNMSNLQEKINKEYPLYDIPNSISKTDEYNGNEIQFIKRSAFKNGYEKCQKEYEEKLRWIPVEEELKPKEDSKRAESDFSIYVLVKDIHGIPQSAYYNYKKKGFYSNAFSEHEIMCVTHWCYIFL